MSRAIERITRRAPPTPRDPYAVRPYGQSRADAAAAAAKLPGAGGGGGDVGTGSTTTTRQIRQLGFDQ